jgi:hypothetical protein
VLRSCTATAACAAGGGGGGEGGGGGGNLGGGGGAGGGGRGGEGGGGGGGGGGACLALQGPVRAPSAVQRPGRAALPNLQSAASCCRVRRQTAASADYSRSR